MLAARMHRLQNALSPCPPLAASTHHLQNALSPRPLPCRREAPEDRLEHGRVWRLQVA